MKAKKRRGAIIFALVMLFIPGVNVIDVFPDFIAYFILAHVLSYGVDKAPYFEEARSGFMKLAAVNLLRIPTSLLINFMRMSDQSDTDVFALATLVFGILETLLFISAASSLFDALFYIGERGDASSTIRKIPFLGKNIEVGALKRLSCTVFAVRSGLAVIPELFLLCKTEGFIVTHPYAPYYPLALTVSLSVSLILGLVWLILSIKYLSAISKEGSYYTAIDALVTEERRPEIENKMKLNRISLALGIMTAAAFFTFEINFDNFGNVNILPHFIFTLLLTVGIWKLVGRTLLTRLTAIFTALHTVVSAVEGAMLIHFLERWSYAEIKLIDEASQAYAPITWLSLAELVLAVAVIVTSTLALMDFAKKNTKIEPTAPNYGIPDRDFHRSLCLKISVYSAFGILTALSKYVRVLLNSGADYTYVGSANGGISAIITTAIPWFGTFMALLSFVYAGCAIYTLGILKDEVKMKYQ